MYVLATKYIKYTALFLNQLMSHVKENLACLVVQHFVLMNNMSLANIEKSQINNANMAYGNFIFTNFNNSNLFSTNLQYANCNNANFDNSNLS